MLMLLAMLQTAQAEPKDDARRHFLAGLSYAQQQNYEEALAEFLKAQDAWPHPNTLYNIAKSYADLGNIEKSLEYYRLYRSAAPDKAGDVDPVIAVLEARLSAQKQPPADLERLRQLREEEAALLQQLREAGVDVPLSSAEPLPEAAPTPEVSADPLELPTNDVFFSDAYQQEVVTASRYGQQPLDSPSTVTVLSTEDIRMSGATTIPDLLRRVAGVEVMSLSAGQVDLSIRGFNRELSNKVLVLIDGRSVYQDFMGTVVWATLPISMEEIERIEIIRGPASAIYGANAVTGVINILTRTPGEGENEVVAKVGGPDYASASASMTGRNKLLSWRIGGGYERVERWNRAAEISEDSPLVPFTNDQETAMRVLRANGRVDIPFLDRGLVSVSGGYADGFTEFYTLGALGNYGFDFQAGNARLDVGFDPVHLRVFTNHLAGDAGPWLEYVGERSLRTRLESSIVDSELEFLRQFSTGKIVHHLNLGASYRFKTIAWDYLRGDGEPIDEHHFAAFLQEDARLGKFGLVGSLRMDRHPLVPITQTLSPRGALIFRAFPRTSLRLSGGTSFRSPTFLESYLTLEQPTAADGYYVMTEGDEQLLPERILSGELGLRDESSRFHTADVAVFVNQVTNLIDLTDLTPNAGAYDPVQEGFRAGTTSFSNRPDTWTGVGVEAELALFPIDGLDVHGTLNWERVFDDDGTEVVVDQATSQWKVNVGASYSSPLRFSLAADIQYASPQVWRLRTFDANGQLIIQEEPIPERLIVSAKVATHPFKDDRLELAVSGWNLGAMGGQRVREHPKGQLVGGRVYGTVGWRF